MDLEDDNGSLVDWALLERVNYEALNWLATRGANLDAKNSSGKRPLHRAVEKGDPTLVTFLLNFGADHQKPDTEDKLPREYIDAAEPLADALNQCFTNHERFINLWQAPTSTGLPKQLFYSVYNNEMTRMRTTFYSPENQNIQRDTLISLLVSWQKKLEWSHNNPYIIELNKKLDFIIGHLRREQDTQLVEADSVNNSIAAPFHPHSSRSLSP